jgi:penicillin-binding protein 2
MQLNSREGTNELRRRLLICGVGVAGMFAGIGLRLYRLQVGQGETWRSLSENNRIRLQRLAATRGLIYDRNGDPLVDNRASFDVVVVPEDTEDLAATIRRVAHFLRTPDLNVKQLLQAARGRPPYEGLVIKRDVDYDAVVALETHQLELPGVSLDAGPLRTYPFGPVGSHLFGYVGEVSEAELEKNHGYRMGDLIGKAGAEKAWETRLRGVPGGQQIEVDALGRKLRVLSRVPQTQGHNMILSVDRRLQLFTEQLMEEHEGSVVVMKPDTGEILAMVSKPTFDPNVFARGIRRDEWRQLTNDKLKPLNNRAIQGQYPPGSTFKIVTAAAALEEGAVTPFTRIFCGGSYAFANRAFRCWKKGGHGSVDLHRALVESCDVYFYQVGVKMGVDAIAEYSHRFGLGEITGISLDHEKPGLIPSTEWKRARFNEPWFQGETLSVAIGQGYVLATPLQMANVIATVANGGTRYRPHLVRRIDNAAGEVVEEILPEVVGNAGLRKSTLLQIREALRDVVNAPNGTGKKAKLPNIDVGGKTGTSQVFKMGKQTKTHHMARHLRDHAWFVAFAPVDAPEIAIAVLIEHAGGGGGAMAAPIAHDVADFYFALTRGRSYQLASAEAPPEREA